MKKILLSLILVLMLCGSAFAAASSITSTWGDLSADFAVMTITCTADSTDGSFVSTAVPMQYPGYVIKVVTNPGSTAPTANYDITLSDSDGVDVMGGMLANRHTSTTEQTVPKVDSAGVYGGSFATGELTVAISNNSVNSAGIVIKVYIQKK